MPTTGGAFEYLAGEWAREFVEYNSEGPAQRSMLYVGHRSDTHPWWHQAFSSACGFNRLAVVDIVAANAQSARHITDEIYVGDVRDLSIVPPGFDLVFWDEGPEHMPREEALRMIQQLADVHWQVLISCPWGYQPQGYGPNDPEFHHWGPMPEDFESIGMKVRTFGTMFDGRGNGHGNLIAWTD